MGDLEPDVIFKYCFTNPDLLLSRVTSKQENKLLQPLQMKTLKEN